MTHDPDARVCAVCSMVLTRVDDRKRGVGWFHPGGRPSDHAAIPVLPSELATVTITCDFCGDTCGPDDGKFLVPVERFEVPIIGGTTGDFAACSRCAALVMKGDWEALKKLGPADPMAQDFLELLNAALRKHMTGPPIPWEGHQ